ncbi:nuclear transport factor 2 family protein [Allokutzneria oryzae]|uniref:Nuclear transport factor 2 family protein n=1 Tax=Allokutzneria oryzae TaxID=1378989 RepID=A0ABV6A1B4_9PSEU
MPATTHQVVDQVRRMVEGKEGIAFADLFATDGVLTYPFAPPGMPRELNGQDAIRAYRGAAAQRRELLDIQGVHVLTRDTDDPEVVVIEVTHHGWAKALDEPYTFTALGILRIRDGKIVRYDDYMDPIAMARLLGRTNDLIASLAAA